MPINAAQLEVKEIFTAASGKYTVAESDITSYVECRTVKGKKYKTCYSVYVNGEGIFDSKGYGKFDKGTSIF